MEPLSFTVKEAAESVKVSEDIIRRWSKMDGFPAIRTPKKIIIPVEGLRRWLREHEGQTV